MRIAWLKVVKFFGGKDSQVQIDAINQGIRDRTQEIKDLGKEGVKTAKQLKQAFKFKGAFGDKSPLDKVKEVFDKSKKTPLGGDAGLVQTPETTVTSAAPKVFNININKLVENFSVNTQNIKEAPGKVKDMVQQALLEALADIEIAR